MRVKCSWSWTFFQHLEQHRFGDIILISIYLLDALTSKRTEIRMQQSDEKTLLRSSINSAYRPKSSKLSCISNLHNIWQTSFPTTMISNNNFKFHNSMIYFWKFQPTFCRPSISYLPSQRVSCSQSTKCHNYITWHLFLTSYQ